METRVRHNYDGALALRAPGSANLTVDTKLNLIDLQRITGGARPLGDLVGKYGLGSFDIVLFVNSFDFTTGDESYVLEFTTYDADGVSTPTIQSTHTVVAADVGKVLWYTFHPEVMKVEHATAAKFSINVNVGGTTPIINLWAYASPHSHQ